MKTLLKFKKDVFKTSHIPKRYTQSDYGRLYRKLNKLQFINNMKMKFSKEKYIGLGHVPIGIGAVIKGWNVTEEHFRNINN
ncbi:MAG: hypothetical protein V1770_01050, partial [bacterium]